MIDQRIGKIKLRRGTGEEAEKVVLEQGELVYLVDKKRLFIGDGITYGGIPISNRSYVVNGGGIPTSAVYGDLIYNSLDEITSIVGYDIDGKTLKLYEIANNGKLRYMQWEIQDLYNKLKPLTPYLDPYVEANPPFITVQPVPKSQYVGSSVKFSIVAIGTDPLVYQWYKDSAKISGQTSSSITINNITENDSAEYKCKVSNKYGYDISDSASLDVKAGVPPVIINHPDSQSPLYLEDISLHVDAEGIEPLTYSWYHDGNLVGVNATNKANTNTLYLNDVQAYNSGKYKCTVSNPYGSDTSNEAILNVIVGNKPSITVQPVTQILNNGLDATFNITAIGTDPLSYQWYKDLVIITGQTKNSITLTKITATDKGSYSCKVSNLFGSVESNGAALIVNVGAPPVITTHPSNQNVYPNADPSFIVAATGNVPITYQWYKDKNLITGATSTTYSLTDVHDVDEGGYYCVATNSFGSINSNVASLNVIDGIAPAITTQPVSLNLNNGLNASFSIVATGTAPLQYQWYKDSVLIAGATNTTYSINNVNAGNAGKFKCKVTNLFGDIESTLANLTVNVGNAPIIGTHPITQTINPKATATFTVVATGTAPLKYQWYKNNVLIIGATNDSYMFVVVNQNDAANYYCKVSNSFGSADSNKATLDVNSAPVITLQPISQSIGTDKLATLSVDATGTAPLSYEWYKNGVLISGINSKTYTFNPTSNILFADKFLIRVDHGRFGDSGKITYKNLYDLFQNGYKPTTVTLFGDAGQSVGYINGVLVVDSGNNTTRDWSYVADISPNDNGSFTYRAADPPRSYGAGSMAINIKGFTYQSVETAKYSCKVSNFVGYVNSTEATVAGIVANLPIITGTGPTITKQPVGTTFTIGDTIKLDVVATGDPVLTYQWKGNDVDIAGATSPTLTINNAKETDAKNYYCIVKNKNGTDTSTFAELKFIKYFSADIIISVDTLNFNLNTKLVELGWDKKTNVNVKVTVNADVKVGSSSTTTAGFVVDSLPTGSIVNLINNGYIVGKGGDGGAGGKPTANISISPGSPGQNGGNAIKTSSNINITNNGNIWGGGGGGAGTNNVEGNRHGAWGDAAGAIGGGGAGYVVGTPNGSFNSGGSGGQAGGGGFDGGTKYSGDGGGPGQNGSPSYHLETSGGRGTQAVTYKKTDRNGGTAGYYIDGNPYVTWTKKGDVRGLVK